MPLKTPQFLPLYYIALYLKTAYRGLQGLIRSFPLLFVIILRFPLLFAVAVAIAI